MEMALLTLILMIASFCGGVYLGRRYSYIKFTMTPTPTP